MKNKHWLGGILMSIILILVFFQMKSVDSSDFAQKNPEIEKKVNALLQKMTLEEKVGQMMQLTLDVLTKGDNVYSSDEPITLDPKIIDKAFNQYKVGSVLNTANNKALTPQKWQELITQIQEASIKSTGIPVLYGVDAIHGTTYTDGATLFPQQIGLAATWNRDIVQKGASVCAYETRASCIPWNFSPVLGVGRDPRWPRQWETFGEDTYLACELGMAMVKGFQGETLTNDPEKLAACAKHFLGYSQVLSGKDRTPAWIPERQLREYFLPPFKDALEAGAMTVMINSGEMNGIPVHANHDILTKLLKEELNFDGFAVTDWQDIEYLHTRHKVAATQKEAVMMAINAGVDMSMIPYNFDFADHLIALVKEGKVAESRVDDAVRRILRVKYLLGLFDKPVTKADDYPKFGSKEFADIARQAALESITLLENKNNILPLSKDNKILVTGPNAHTMRSLNGGWSYSWQGEKADQFAEEFQTIVEALQERVGEKNVTFVEGVSYDADKFFNAHEEDHITDIDAVINAAANVDAVVLCLGENTYTEKPGDLEDLYLSKNQMKLAKTLQKTGKPIILVLNEGRPRVVSKIVDDMSAVLHAYLPGNFGGEAVAKILLGEENPSGRLPYTYPRYPNSLVTYDHKYTEELESGSVQYKSFFAPQWEFAHGLSYTTFEYSDLTLSNQQFNADEVLTVSVTVKNTGDMDGKVTVPLFVSDLYASITPSVKRLRGFEKIFLKAGQSKDVTFKLEMHELSFINSDYQAIIEAGEFEVKIGDQSQKFTLTSSKAF